MRRTALVTAVLTLGLAPWMPAPPGWFFVTDTPSYAQASFHVAAPGPEGVAVPAGGVGSTPGSANAGAVSGAPTAASVRCTCGRIVVEASNEVRDAEVRSGDVRSVNRTITYVAPGFNDDRVRVRQRATAKSGDAVAGQVLGVAGGGCSEVTLRARNLVEDSEVRSGDAIARNESLVLVHPDKRGDLDVRVRQRATAESGDAIAGQIIGATGGPCGVVVDAVNEVRDTDVESGQALAENISRVLQCADVQCLDALGALLSEADRVRVCAEKRCRRVPVSELIAVLEKDLAKSAEPSPTPKPAVSPEPSEEGEPSPAPTPQAREGSGGTSAAAEPVADPKTETSGKG